MSLTDGQRKHLEICATEYANKVLEDNRMDSSTTKEVFEHFRAQFFYELHEWQEASYRSFGNIATEGQAVVDPSGLDPEFYESIERQQGE